MQIAQIATVVDSLIRGSVLSVAGSSGVQCTPYILINWHDRNENWRQWQNTERTNPFPIDINRKNVCIGFIQLMTRYTNNCLWSNLPIEIGMRQTQNRMSYVQLILLLNVFKHGRSYFATDVLFGFMELLHQCYRHRLVCDAKTLCRDDIVDWMQLSVCAGVIA